MEIFTASSQSYDICTHVHHVAVCFEVQASSKADVHWNLWGPRGTRFTKNNLHLKDRIRSRVHFGLSPGGP
jgi:hypothetical protein